MWHVISRSSEVISRNAIIYFTTLLYLRQSHKSRSRSSEVTVGITPLSHLPASCQTGSLSVTSRRSRGNGNAAICREVSEIVWLLHRHISKTASRTKKLLTVQTFLIFNFIVEGQGCLNRQRLFPLFCAMFRFSSGLKAKSAARATQVRP